MHKETHVLDWNVWRTDELPPADHALKEAALEAAKRAYAPYSSFCVGAAVQLADGTVVTGNNQENAAYPSGICAERTTLFAASAAYPQQPPETLALAAIHEGSQVPFISPCGACRQVMMETESRYHRPLRILLCGRDETWEIASVHDLMPLWGAPKCADAPETSSSKGA